MRIAAGIEYRGTGYAGWQRQDSGPTIQQHVEHALGSVADQPIEIQCAGRTDAGVHALGQVIHFDTTARREPRSWIMGANVDLPADIAVLWAAQIPDEFHARYSAISRAYRYLILNRRSRPGALHGLVTWEYRDLDEQRMQEAAGHLLGEHDFSSFRGAGCSAQNPVREIREIRVTRDRDLLCIEIRANAFLQHMVRNIAGVLMAIGSGGQPVEWIGRVLDARDRSAGGVTAPPDGLYLVNVEYPGEFVLPRIEVPPWRFCT